MAYAIYSWFGWSRPALIAGPFATRREAESVLRQLWRDDKTAGEPIWIEQISAN